MISDQKDGKVLNLFFSIVKKKIGMNLRPNVFMSDMAEELYTAWEEVMGCPKQQIFCIWHVLEKWKENLREKVKDKDLRDNAYKKLRTIRRTR